MNVAPGEKVAGLFVSLFLSKAVLVKFASGERAAAKAFSYEKQALVDMAQADRRVGITEADMQGTRISIERSPTHSRKMPFGVRRCTVRDRRIHASRTGM